MDAVLLIVRDSDVTNNIVMRTSWIFLVTGILMCEISSCQSSVTSSITANQQIEKTIFVYGDGLDKVFIRFVAGLTNKRNPKICFFPTAAADDERAIGYWYRLCEDLPVTPSVLQTFISSSPEQKTFE